MVAALLMAGAVLPAPHAVQADPGDPVATSFIYPVGDANIPPTWNPKNGNGYFITQGFNDSCDPGLGEGYYEYGLYYCGHTGIDLASQSADATVHATAAGVVTEAQEDGGYGVTVRMRHLLPSGQMVYSQYEHMQYGSLQVYVGETVRQSQALGLVGATGFANGTHLHFELKTFDAGGPGYTFGNQDEIKLFFDPLAFVAAHSIQPNVLITPSGKAIPEWPAEADAVLRRFLAHYLHFVVVNESHGLYVRSGPGTRYAPLGVALQGARLGYLKAVGKWLYVALPQDVKGWVSSDWVTGYQNWDRPWPPRGAVAMVDTLGLNIHSKPGQRHPVLGITFEGNLVSVQARTAHWTRILTREGTRGWVLNSYLMAPGAARARGGGQTISAAASVLNVRRGPGLEYPLIGTVFKGTPLQLVRLSPHWAAVVLPGGTTGWVARSYTNLDAASHQRKNTRPTSHHTAPAVYLKVDVAVINIHSAPGQRHTVVARAFKNTPLQLLGLSPNWAHVALPASNIQGWVLRRLTRR